MSQSFSTKTKYKALRGGFHGGSIFVISFQSKERSPTPWGCLLWYFDYMQGSFGSRYVLIHFTTISFPEAAILLVSDGDRDLWLNLWPGPTPEVRDSRTSRDFAHAESQVWQIWLVLVAVYCVYTAIVGPDPGSRFQAHDKRDPWGRGWFRNINRSLSNRRMSPAQTIKRYSFFTSKCFDILILPTREENKPLVGTLMTIGDVLEGYSQENWVGVCGQLPPCKTFTLLITKIGDIPYPIYDLNLTSKS